MKKRVWNLVILLVGASVFLTAHFYQTDTDQVSIKHTIFPGKSSYRYVPDYPAYKRPGYKSGSSWYSRDYSAFKTDSSLLFDKTIVTLYDVTNKTKDYLIVPVTISWEEQTSTSSGASYAVIGAVASAKYSVLEYFIMDPKETMKGMYTFSKPPTSFSIVPEPAQVVEKKWVQGLQQALGGDKKKLEQYLNDTLATPAFVKLKDKLSEILQKDLIKNISLKFTSTKATNAKYGYPLELNFEAVNKNPYTVQATISADCFDKTTYATFTPDQNRSLVIGINRDTSCDTLTAKFTVKKVSITGINK